MVALQLQKLHLAGHREPQSFHLSSPSRRKSPTRSPSPSAKQQHLSLAHLVKALQQAHDPSLNLLLVQSTAGAVKPHGLEGLDTGHDGGGSGSEPRGGDDGGP